MRSALVAMAVAGMLAATAPGAQAATPVRSCKGAYQEGSVRVAAVKTIRVSCALARELAQTYVVSVELSGDKSLSLVLNRNQKFSCRYRKLSGKAGRPLAKIACIRGDTRVYFYRTKLNPNPDPDSLAG